MPNHMSNRAHGHRVSTEPGSQRVRVVIDGHLVADCARPVLLHETGLPVRYYLPAEDVRLELFEPTDTATTCPFKGQASYWAFRGGSRIRPDVAWAYQDPYPQVAAIKGHLAFYDAAAEITVED
jgi:uncharacterized protein (DUF427 family)